MVDMWKAQSPSVMVDDCGQDFELPSNNPHPFTLDYRPVGVYGCRISVIHFYTLAHS